MKLDEEILWQYIDNQLDTKQSKKVQQLINQSLEWQNAHQEALQLQQELQATELDVPSLRFSQNVMDKLPADYRTVQGKNLVTRSWLQRLTLAIFLMISAGVAVVTQFTQTTASSSFLEQWISQSAQQSVFVIFGLVAFVVVILAVCDHFLEKKFKPKMVKK